ncbi:hypothetical protein D3C87_588170 [compost metagenome]
MARKWPDHFEQQRLNAERQQQQAIRRFEIVLKNIPKNLKDKLVSDILDSPGTSVFMDYSISIRMHGSQLEEDFLKELYERTHQRMRSFTHNFLNLCDRLVDQVDDVRAQNLIAILDALDYTKVPYELNKTLRARILIAKLTKD